jgi:hypothetical protein
MIHRIFALVFAGLIVVAAPSASRPVASGTTIPTDVAPGEPRAAAWMATVSLPSAEQLLEVGHATAASGSRPTATAAAFNINGQGTGTVIADLKNNDVEKDVQNFTDPPAAYCPPPLQLPGRDPIGLCDPGGNMHLRGGFAEAHASGASSSSQAGIADGTFNGFAFASKNFSFNDQSTALNTVQQVDDAIVAPINTLLGQTTQALTGGAVDAPHLEGIPPAGLIDILDLGAGSGSAQTSTSPGYNAAKANAELGTVKILGGFIELHNVRAFADSESSNGQDSRDAHATIGGITIAGVAVKFDEGAFTVAGNTEVDRQVLQPAFDLMMSALQQAGLTIKVASVEGLKDLKEATAFELSWTTPNGLINISIGHAEASASSVGAPSVGGGECCPIPPSTGGVTPPSISGPGSVGGPTGPVPSVQGTQTTRSGPVVRSLGPAAARAIRTAYLIFLVTGFVASLGYPMFVRRHWSRRRTVLA